MKVTVLIATRNRSEGLRRTLESLFCESNLSRQGWEVVVVLNGAVNDGTEQVCRVFGNRYPGRFRYLEEPRQGKSKALNLGIRAARGDILALTDDDAICEPDYISSIMDIFEQYPVDLAQGRVFLECEGGLPEWMGPKLREFMSEFDHGDNVLLPFDHHMTGTNMIVRRGAARRVGGFAPELGPGTIGYGDDTEFALRMRRAGYRTMYAPQIVVRHQVPRRRLTKSFFRNRYFRLGRTQAYYLPCDISVWKHARYALKEACLNELKAIRCRYRGRPADSVYFQCRARWRIGLALQYCLFRLGASSRLTRVTSWPEPAVAREGGIGQTPVDDGPRRETENGVSPQVAKSHHSGSPA